MGLLSPRLDHCIASLLLLLLVLRPREVLSEGDGGPQYGLPFDPSGEGPIREDEIPEERQKDKGPRMDTGLPGSPDAPVEGEGSESYEEFGDYDYDTDIDQDPGSWVQVLDPKLRQEIIEGEQAVYVDGVRKMVDAFGKGEPSELPEAIRVLQTAADQGHPHAQSTLAYLYGSGTGLKLHGRKAVLYHHFAADGGNFQSKMALAYSYCRQQRFDEAVQIYAEVAARAMASLLSLESPTLLEPRRLNAGFEESRSTLKMHRGEVDEDYFQYQEFQASKGNDGNAMVFLGESYYFGVRGVNRNHTKALSWFLKAADKGFPKAMEFAGEIYARGYGVPRDYNKSRHMFEEAIRREQGSAYNGLGYLYVKGLGVEKKDPIKALEFFEKAAEHKSIHAHYNLGVMYLRGSPGVKRNPIFAVSNLTYAFYHKHPKAYYQLAKLYEKGFKEGGIDRSLILATAWYKKVAEWGPWSSLMRVGVDSYLEGQMAKAYLFYSRAAELGYEVAQSNAAWILQKASEEACFGRSGFCTVTERDLRSHALWQLASEQGNEHAALLIGDAHYYGKGTKQDLERAAEAYRRAQMQQNPQAMFNLGYMHEHGLGLPMDLHLAKRFYDQALQTDPQAVLPVTIALAGLWLRQNYGGSIVVKILDSLPEAIPAAGERIWSLMVEEGNATLAALFVCLFTVLYLLFRRRQRRIAGVAGVARVARVARVAGVHPVIIVVAGLVIYMISFADSRQRQNYGGNFVVKILDSLPGALPAVEEWISSKIKGDNKATFAVPVVAGVFAFWYIGRRVNRGRAGPRRIWVLRDVVNRGRAGPRRIWELRDVVNVWGVAVRAH